MKITHILYLCILGLSLVSAVKFSTSSKARALNMANALLKDYHTFDRRMARMERGICYINIIK